MILVQLRVALHGFVIEACSDVSQIGDAFMF